jgi:hypothetical protein
MRALIFRLGLLLLVCVPVSLALGLAQALWAADHRNLLVAVVFCPVLVMVGAALLPDS